LLKDVDGDQEVDRVSVGETSPDGLVDMDCEKGSDRDRIVRL